MTINIFKDKVCWITGASSGIGAALAQQLSKAGAYVILSARNREQLEAVKEGSAFPWRMQLLDCDMEQTDQLETIAMEAWKMKGHIDHVFLNAGMAVRDRVIRTRPEMIRKVMDVNFMANVVITRTLLPLMIARGGGQYIVTSSLSGKFGVPQLSAYAASKHALHGFFESLRAESESQGIRVTLAVVGLVKTHITLNALQGDGSRYDRMEESIARGITPERCAMKILAAAARSDREVLVGGAEVLSVLVKRFFPSLHSWLMARHPVRRLRNLLGTGKVPTERPVRMSA